MHYIYRKTTQFSFHFELKENRGALDPHKHLCLPYTTVKILGQLLYKVKSPVELT